jgi:F0F1-type ATP synthase delta subunit
MTLAQSYAQALFAAQTEHPTDGAKHLGNLRTALAHKGHEKLLSQIFAEYSKIEEKKARRLKYEQVTPESEKTRILLELYRKLVTS